MNKYTIIIAQVCAILLALIVMVLLALDKGGSKANADGVPPDVDTNGLCVVEVAEPEYEMVERNIAGKEVILDPFARECKCGTITNDLTPTRAYSLSRRRSAAMISVAASRSLIYALCHKGARRIRRWQIMSLLCSFTAWDFSIRSRLIRRLHALQ